MLEVVEEHGVQAGVGGAERVEEDDGVCLDEGADVEDVDEEAGWADEDGGDDVRHARVDLAQVAWLWRVSEWVGQRDTGEDVR